jgi:cobalt/nickel transport system permease protein
MHIPDGYLSPVTCLSLYGASTPFWYVGLRELRKQLHTRLLPSLSLFAAFSFVIMMFNIPLPGGTSAHAVGLGLGAALLGPWASMIAISLALLIQAVLFGDGGVTALGANCLNMAIAGSLVAAAVYRLVSGNSPLTSLRRVVGSALGGYLGLNVAALLAAVEFGVQPILFKDAHGAPAYAPYSLAVALPAMMIGHLAVAGIAEALISGGIIAYLQKVNLPLLSRMTGLTAATSPNAGSLRPVWASLALLMILTPLGLVATGTAWGEWSSADLRNPETRRQIEQLSGASLPQHTPVGLERLSSVWTAPMPDYAPPVLKSRGFGYILSAFFGTGAILLTGLLVNWFLTLPAKRSPRVNYSAASERL